ncbi:DUF3326 domain-containing protein [bacterium]|nr:DUF3326 domain-containing protein [bacterium]
MTYNREKLGAFVVPTGVGASIGGYAGDASTYARNLAKHSKLIVNPNVVNAGCFSGITSNMLYTEGYTLDSFFKGEINLIPSENNKIGIIYDKAIPQDVLNVHINTQNAVKTVYGTDIRAYEITEENAGVEFYVTKDGYSTGSVKNITTVENSCQKLINKGCDAIAIVCLFKDDNSNEEYANGLGVDPVGGVEAIISHDISKKFKIPCAHSPAFIDYQIYPDLINPKSASEYITPTFLPCVLIGLSQAPKISKDTNTGINISNLDFLVMPYNSLGSTPVYEAVKRGIETFAVLENKTELDITKEKLFANSNIKIVNSYEQIAEYLKI